MGNIKIFSPFGSTWNTSQNFFTLLSGEHSFLSLSMQNPRRPFIYSRVFEIWQFRGVVSKKKYSFHTIEIFFHTIEWTLLKLWGIDKYKIF